MNDQSKGQMSIEDNTSDIEEINFGETAFKLWDDTIEHVSVQMKNCLKNLEEKENRQCPCVISDMLDTLRSCVKALELLQQLEKDASGLREQLPKKS